MGSLGDEVAQLLSEHLGWELLNRSQLIDRFFKDSIDARERHLLSDSARFYLDASPAGDTYLMRLQQGLANLANQKDLILLGFGSQIIFAGRADTLHIRVTAPREVRLARVAKDYHVSAAQAIEILDRADRKHRRFVQTLFGADCTDETLYHAVFNTGLLSQADLVSAVLDLKTRQTQPSTVLTPRADFSGQSSSDLDAPVFKNSSEAEFAQILDMHQIHWVYEPKTFPVEWDAEGNVTLAFSPDFYLTQFDTYLELTTMNQRYVSEKKKKLRRVRELYPGIQIKIIFKKDFAELIERFSRFGS